MKTRIIEFGADGGPGEPAFDSTGKWLAVPVNYVSIEKFLREDPSPEDYPQPKIQIIDVGSGQIAETLLAPQAYLYTACFSPDGHTLATSGDGEVLLWDFSTPPGEKPK
jgi:WD40 repeat protein